MRAPRKYFTWILATAFAFLLVRCEREQVDPPPQQLVTTPYELNVPANFPPPDLPTDNPLTVEGVRLGRYLFYEKKLSGNNTQACGDCHLQDQNFSDFNQFSTGIDGIAGDRQAMPIMNLAWQSFFFWDGRKGSLEDQALDPVENPIEMHETWPNALVKLKNDPFYVGLFAKAFGSGSAAINKTNAAKAIAQFERTLVSGNSKFDKWRRGEAQLTAQEAAGYQIFNSERGDCFHCHGDLATGNQFGAYGSLQFTNNGLDSVLTPGKGRDAVTGLASDRGKFKIPSLRNIEYSFPYMHDGRFANLDEVIDFYNTGGFVTPTTDPNMKAAGVGRNWTPQEKADLKAFLLTLSDVEFLTDTIFSSPF